MSRAERREEKIIQVGSTTVKIYGGVHRDHARGVIEAIETEQNTFRGRVAHAIGAHPEKVTVLP